jgi:hypothetical protein
VLDDLERRRNGLAEDRDGLFEEDNRRTPAVDHFHRLDHHQHTARDRRPELVPSSWNGGPFALAGDTVVAGRLSRITDPCGGAFDRMARSYVDKIMVFAVLA